MSFRSDIFYTEEQLLMFRETMPSRDVLEWCRSNHYMLIAGPHCSMSITQLRSLHRNYFWNRDAFCHVDGDVVETNWIMMSKKPLLSSNWKTWDEQQVLLSDNEVVPNVTEVAWCLTTYRIVRHIFLLSNSYVITSSPSPVIGRFYVGVFDVWGLCIGVAPDGRGEKMHILPARKM